MPRTRRRAALLGTLLATAVAGAAALPAGPATAGPPAPTGGSVVAGTLPRLTVTSDYVTGISSGGYMATQLQVAWSSRFAGAGIFSAGPYHCGKDSVVIALEACTSPVVVPDDLPGHVAYTDAAAADGLIDPTSNLATSRTWAFHGTRDTVVATSVADDLAAYYRHYGVPLTYVSDVPAGHAWISPLGPGACGDNAAPYVNHCPVDEVGAMLSTVLGGHVTKPTAGAARGQVIAFSQDPYAVAPRLGAGDVTRTGAAAIGMGGTGYAYVPASCAKGEACRVVVALHGCLQTADQIGTTFVDDAGLDQYADTNHLAVLYPQATPDSTFGNPKGCWDWWGYLGADDAGYATKAGPQMQTVMAMVAALGG